MSVQKSFTFYSSGTNQLTWTLKDMNDAVIDTATVTATLYWGRDRLKPDQIPGIAINGFSQINLPFDVTLQAYTRVIDAIDGLPNGGDYVLVVDVTDSFGNQLSHWERPAVVVEYGP